MSMVRADGMAHIPRFSEGLNAGDEVIVELLRSPGVIDHTIVHLGSHDMTLDLLADETRDARPGSDAVVSRLCDIVVIQAIRSWIDRDPAAAGFVTRQFLFLEQ